MRYLTFAAGSVISVTSAALAGIIGSAPPRPMQAEAFLLMLLCMIVGLALCCTAAWSRRAF